MRTPNRSTYYSTVLALCGFAALVYSSVAPSAENAPTVPAQSQPSTINSTVISDSVFVVNNDNESQQTTSSNAAIGAASVQTESTDTPTPVADAAISATSVQTESTDKPAPTADVAIGAASAQAESTDTPTPTAEDQARVKQLSYIQSVLDAKLTERRQIGDRIAAANEQDKADLRRDANVLTNDIGQLRITLETIATGGVDRKLFEEETTQEKKDWREDVSLIAQPVLDSLKEITEKPRRIKELNELIDLKNQEIVTSSTAIEQLQRSNIIDSPAPLQQSLNGLINKWQKRQNDANDTIAVAQIQLKSLEGNQPISTTIYEALVKFAKGRGLTILMAIAAAWLVLISVKLIMKTYRHTLVDKKQKDSRTRYRVAKYSVQALTFTLVLIAVFIVFYERHDVLLLGLLILLIVGFVLNAKQLLPRYVKEARLLLNLGAMREGERVIYNGLPFRVESINMYTIFRNPELNGILRIPLAELTKISSRPVSRDSWFPTSKGDVVLMADGTLLEVLNQNPDTVELKKRGGELLTLPAIDFYALTMTNLTRLGTFGVTGSFGVDYNHQDISVTEIPRQLREGVKQALEASNLGEHLQDVRVELDQAGGSSIDYWIFITMDSAAARSYYRVHRIIQSACIETCGRKGWSIPFPHMSVVQKPLSANDASVSSNDSPFSATG